MTAPTPQAGGWVERLRAFADAKYIRGCEIAMQTECLGFEYKMANGGFGPAEYAAHQKGTA